MENKSIYIFLSLVFEYFRKEIDEHKVKGRLPLTFELKDSLYYEKMLKIRNKTERLAYLRTLIPMINMPPAFAVPFDAGGIHTGFLTAHRVLRQADLINMATWNYLKAQRLDDNLYINCSNLSSPPLTQLLIDMRAKFNLLTEPWWPILVGISQEKHREIIQILQSKHQLHGAHIYAWETQEKLPNTQKMTLICANRGETIFEINPNDQYMIQIDADHNRCTLGIAPDTADKQYKSIVKLESRIK